jgi:hypothetical protein
MAWEELIQRGGGTKLAGHSVDLIADPLSAWDTLDVSYYVVYGGKQPSSQ